MLGMDVTKTPLGWEVLNARQKARIAKNTRRERNGLNVTPKKLDTEAEIVHPRWRCPRDCTRVIFFHGAYVRRLSFSPGCNHSDIGSGANRWVLGERSVYRWLGNQISRPLTRT